MLFVRIVLDKDGDACIVHNKTPSLFFHASYQVYGSSNEREVWQQGIKYLTGSLGNGYVRHAGGQGSRATRTGRLLPRPALLCLCACATGATYEYELVRVHLINRLPSYGMPLGTSEGSAVV